MKRIIALATFLLAPACALAQSLTPVVVSACGTPPQTYHAGQSYPMTMDTTGTLCAAGSGGGGASSVNIASVNGVALGSPSAYGTSPGAIAVPGVNAFVTNPVTSVTSGAITNPTSTLTMTSATTAYTTNQLIASSATAGSIVVPSFAIANSAGGAIIKRLRLDTADATSTAWGSQTVTVDLWSVAPTFTNGDRGTYSPSTGTGAHLGQFTCALSAEYGDGAYSECSSVVDTMAVVKLASGTSVFWTLTASTGSGVTGASKVWTLTAELVN